jgi:hypothetical protein
LRYRLLDWLTVIFSIISGSTLIVLGVYICFIQLTASLEVILQSILLMGVMIFVGVQITSIATNGLLSNEEKIRDLNYVTKTLSYTLAALLFIFAIDMYALSWTVNSSSMFIIMWGLGLVLLIKRRSRLLSVSCLLLGSTTATWAWVLLGDVLFPVFGCTLIIGLIVLLLLTITGDSTSPETLDDTDVILNSPETEKLQLREVY